LRDGGLELDANPLIILVVVVVLGELMFSARTGAHRGVTGILTAAARRMLLIIKIILKKIKGRIAPPRFYQNLKVVWITPPQLEELFARRWLSLA